MYLWAVSFVQLFMPFLNFEYTMAVTYAVEIVGGGVDQDPATDVTYLRLNHIYNCVIVL